MGAPLVDGLPVALQNLMERNMRAAARAEKKGAEKDSECHTSRRHSLEVMRDAREEAVVGFDEDAMLPVSTSRQSSRLSGGVINFEDMDRETFGVTEIDADLGGGLDFGGQDYGGEVEDIGYTPVEMGTALGDDTQIHQPVEVVDKKTGWSIRTQLSLGKLKVLMQEADEKEVPFVHVVKAAGKALCARQHAAHQFFEMLVLHSKSYVEMLQDAPYAPLLIRQSDNFNTSEINPVLSY